MTDNVSLSTLGIKDYTNAGVASTNKTAAELDQEDFFALLVAQLENQDPLKPQDNTEFVTQMAQFTQLDSTQALQSSFEEFVATQQSNQALQASALVGRNVSIETDKALLQDGKVVKGAVELDATVNDMNVSVYSQSGQLIREIPIGRKEAGTVNFSWDGLNDGGDAVPAGSYIVKATATVGDQTVQLPTAMQANVNSVTLGNTAQGTQGLVLNLADYGAVRFDQIKEIN